MMTDIKTEMLALGQAAKNAADVLRLATAQAKNEALKAIAQSIAAHADTILTANALDMEAGRAKGLSPALLDRLLLTQDRIAAIVGSVEAIAANPDPVGIEDARWTRPNGLTIAKVRIPIGVIGIIYESRPNVTVDAGALCLKSGNACILRGGTESARSNAALHAAMTAALRDSGIPPAAISFVTTTDRAAVGDLLSGLEDTVNLIIPRGGKSLIARVQRDARVPVLAHLDGINHSYIHANADVDMAIRLVTNAKMRRTGICGATETVLIDAAIAPNTLPRLAQDLTALGCELRGDRRAQALEPSISAATETDFATEHLAPILNIAIVDGPDAALAHIARFGSGHTDAVITQNTDVADYVIARIDSAICVHNASTQFADGGEFGFGAEIGIATGRLHARGPVGAQHLTTFKYVIHGEGQIRP